MSLLGYFHSNKLSIEFLHDFPLLSNIFITFQTSKNKLDYFLFKKNITSMIINRKQFSKLWYIRFLLSFDNPIIK